MKERGGGIYEEVKRFSGEIIWITKIKEFIVRWDALLKDVKPSEKGFSVKSVREDRESH